MSTETSNTEKPNPETVKVSIHQGRSFTTGDHESFRVDYSIESEVPRSSVVEAVDKWDSYLDVLISRKAKKILSTKLGTLIRRRKPPPTPDAIDLYSGLSWRQSENYPNLQTIPVTTDLSPVEEALYVTLKKSENKTLRVKDATYRLVCVTADGAELLQRWSIPSEATT
jgi:hypothetical protein